MRIERKGPVAKLSPRLERFIVEALGGKLLDEMQHAEARKADYKCLGGLLVIELKTLEKDASERINNLMDELRERPDWPMFLGSAPILSVLKHMDQPEELKRRLVERIGRAIKDHLSKANKQLEAHAASFPRKNMVKIIVLANEDHEIYDPKLVAQIVQRLLLRHQNGIPLYPHVDAVMFFTERHAAAINREVSFPILCVESKSIDYAEWKRDVTEFLLTRWASWSGIRLDHFDIENFTFTTIDHISGQMMRYEQWELNYKRNRYMRDYTNEALRERFDEMICIASLAFIKTSPLKPAHDAVEWSMASMSHVMLEMGWRGIPIAQFRYGSERLAAAARRMHMPAIVVAWFQSNMGRAA